MINMQNNDFALLLPDTFQSFIVYDSGFGLFKSWPRVVSSKNAVGF